MNVAVKADVFTNQVHYRTGHPLVVVIGTGPSGIRVLEELHALLPDQPIVIYGGEPWRPYNRVRLSSLLAGEVSHNDILLTPDVIQAEHVTTRLNCKVVSIDRINKTVIDQDGHIQPYSRLVIATGSNPYIPEIPGNDLHGVYKFRDLNDTEKLVARRTRSKKTVVLGGGLLGLEAARAMQRLGTHVTVIEHSKRLLFRQLDDDGAAILTTKVEELGIEVVLNDSIMMITGSLNIQSVVLRSGREIECDTLIISAGIKPDIDLAMDASLAYGRGITVNARMQTSDPDIYAIGECCEYNNELSGIVAPGYEQAAIAARNIADLPAYYQGTVLASSLKIVGQTVFSMGDIDDSVHNYTRYVYREGNIYRRLNVYRGQVVGVIAVGDWPELIKLREHAKKGKSLLPWQLWRFNQTGELWGDDGVQNVNTWPAEATICSCNGISRSQLTNAINTGCNTLALLAAKTGASTVCGSCKPLLVNMLGGNTALEPVRAYKPLFYSSMIFLVTCLLAYIAPPIPYTSTVQVPWRWDMLWTTSLYKQISGFTLLGLSVLVLILSLRKRIRWIKLGDFPLWRLAHVLLGGFAVFVLLVHTGFRLGSNLNFMLMMCFTGLIFVGAVTAGVIAMEHKLEAAAVKQIRSAGLWLHILLFWPLPVLLGFHIFKTYYF